MTDDTTRIPGLRPLAAFLGLQTSYVDGTGVRRNNSTDSVAAMIEALVGRRPSAPRLILRELLREKTARLLEPVSVAWLPGDAGVKLNLPPAGAFECQLEDSDGDVRGWRAEPDSDGLLALPALLPGYYRLHLKCGDLAAHCLVIAAPRRAFLRPGGGREWGAFLPLYALRSASSWGIGDLHDLSRLSRYIAGLGGGGVATLPLTSNFFEPGFFEPSPYSPASRLMWNELYLDVTALPEFRESNSAREIVASPDFQREIEALNSAGFVDYRGVHAAKRRVLSEIAASLSPQRQAEVRRFAEEKADVEAYALFRARTERDGPWPGWPDVDLPQGPGSPEDQAAVAYHGYAQFAMESQLAAFKANGGPGLYLDLPLGVNSAGFDTWRWRDDFLPVTHVGAAPDALAPRGQDWGFPAINPVKARDHGHEYFIAVLRHHMRHASRLRLDHVMGFHRLFVIPPGIDSRDGVYLRYPAQELYAILNLESHLNQTEIVGENLGTVPGYVNEELKQRSIAGMYVFPWEIHPGQDPPIAEPSSDDIATLNTHDMPPFAAWWDMDDIDARAARGELTAEVGGWEKDTRRWLQGAVVGYLRWRGLISHSEEHSAVEVRAGLDRLFGASPARLFLANLEDFWGEKEPQNIPGTMGDHNWRRKARLTLEEIESSAEVRAALVAIDEARRQG